MVREKKILQMVTSAKKEMQQVDTETGKKGKERQRREQNHKASVKSQEKEQR